MAEPAATGCCGLQDDREHRGTERAADLLGDADSRCWPMEPRNGETDIVDPVSGMVAAPRPIPRTNRAISKITLLVCAVTNPNGIDATVKIAKPTNATTRGPY